MRLFLDIGNTAMKWRACDDVQGVRTQGGRAHQRDWALLAEELAAVCSAPVTSLWVASVAGQEGDAALAVVLEKALGCAPRFYYSPARDAGVTNAYAEPARLGVDRWLAVVETWHRHGASIIVDCGSALTVDAVNADGQHLGGYIVPGLTMLKGSLSRGTAQVRITDQVEHSLAPGCSTSAGVENGVLRMSVAFIADTVVELRKALDDTDSVYLTGGDARVLQPFLPPPMRYDPDLVLDGLERVTGTGGENA
ncbi:type III pantothenate kinase [Alcanivorax sp. JB21]|uniref:type III pantothenate kinase n=1 Tax=Alcanivorax limicola TaxID=2874102 RepID=UPI001CC0D845|nr:type III pantothenate kinase [Alcanivorax limicola]MBZ2190586.1 type III pantothenate kinase [Alcanivorax limicola]